MAREWKMTVIHYFIPIRLGNTGKCVFINCWLWCCCFGITSKGENVHKMLSLITMREQSDEPTLRGILQDNWPGLKNVSVIKDKKEKKRLRNSVDWKRLKRHSKLHLNTMPDSCLYSGLKKSKWIGCKGHYWDNMGKLDIRHLKHFFKLKYSFYNTVVSGVQPCFMILI